MRKSLLLLIIMLTSIVHAKDWIVLDIDVAKKAVAVLKNQDYIIFWCDCCHQDKKAYKSVNNVFMQPYQDSNYYTISFMDLDGNVYNQIDLSQIFINYKSKAVNLANYMKLSPVKLCNYGSDFFGKIDSINYAAKDTYNEVNTKISINNESVKEVIIIDLDSYYKENSRFLSNEINFLTYENENYISTKPIQFQNDETLFIARDSDASAIFLLKKKYSDNFSHENILYEGLTLILANGEEIELQDFNIRGHNYQYTFKIFFLDEGELHKLRKNNIKSIKYFFTPKSHIELIEQKSKIQFSFETINEINYIF